MFAYAVSAQTLEHISQSQSSFEHGGRNGGDGLEIEMELIARQILKYLESPNGSQQFPEINISYLKRVVNVVDFRVTREVIIDRFGIDRTCINDISKMLVECNISRWGMIKDPRVYYVLIFHELLGLMSIELGSELDVSRYPISSRLIPLIDEVRNQDSSDDLLSEEYFGLENPAFGMTLQSKKSREELRMICMTKTNLHGCDYFSIVRRLDIQQAPLLKGLPPLSRSMIKQLTLRLENLKKKSSVTKKMRLMLTQAIHLVNYSNDLTLMGHHTKIKQQHYNQIARLLLLELENIKTACFSSSSAQSWCGL
jgi:hypothetical protein